MDKLADKQKSQNTSIVSKEINKYKTIKGKELYYLLIVCELTECGRGGRNAVAE